MPKIEGAPDALSVSELRWRCDPASLGFASTAELEPERGVIGQEEAMDALRFGLEIHAPGQNIYVRGREGTGRLTAVRRLLEEIRPRIRPAPDRLFVHDFDRPDRPKLLEIERGRGEAFGEAVAELRRYITKDLPNALSGELVASRRKQLEQHSVEQVREELAPLEAALAEAGLALVVRESGGVTQRMILPLHPEKEGQAVPPNELPALIESGVLTQERMNELEEASEGFRDQVAATFRKVASIQRQLRHATANLVQNEAETLLGEATAELRESFEQPAVHAWLDSLIHDFVHRRLGELDKLDKYKHRYEVNEFSCHAADEPAPVIVESVASARSLIGSIDITATPEGTVRADHSCVRAGSLIQADGGVLVLEANELLTQPGAWPALVRSLRASRVEILMPERTPGPSLKPEAIPIQVKVVLIGSAGIYRKLDQLDPNFPYLFKVLADFDSQIPRGGQSLALYARVLRRVADKYELPHFSADAVAELAEHGARIASSKGKLSARLGRLSDLAREAAFLATKAEAELVSGEHVRETVRRTKRRASLPARRFREQVIDGRIRVATEGRARGQVNGLAVISTGPLTYGFPTRISATLGAGTGGTINIERESKLSGAIHTKAFYILGGLLRHLLDSQHPLSFEASIAFEQSYGGIDGDSASGAEIVCLLSALCELPVRQDLSMTGAIDQHGNILPIGAVNEKIEGFYDTCCGRELTGTQGVIIPVANVGDLMLRHDVVEACEAGRFHVYAVDRIHEAISLFFDHPAGERDPGSGFYPEGSVLHQAVMSAFNIWQRTQATPADFEIVDAGPGGQPN